MANHRSYLDFSHSHFFFFFEAFRGLPDREDSDELFDDSVPPELDSSASEPEPEVDEDEDDPELDELELDPSDESSEPSDDELEDDDELEEDDDLRRAFFWCFFAFRESLTRFKLQRRGRY